VLSPGERKEILRTLTAAETFERLLDRRYTGTKRFGIEGAESLMPALEAVLSRGSQLGIREFVIGMPHRGRLNVLANFVGKPFAAIFSEFQGNSTNPEHVHGSGDVKYHLGTSGNREVNGETVHLSLGANPSHLEAVNPVVLGKVRAKQLQRGDSARAQVAGILMHGDAASPAEGRSPNPRTVNVLDSSASAPADVHVIVNNQIGFTTAPAARSSPYPSDAAKGVQAPIFHVNGDDPEAVVEVARAAAEFREEFKKDVVIDLFCYRRHGHNESDEPAFTQPLMYRTIARHSTTRQIYAKRLVEAGALREGEADAMATGFIAELEAQFDAAKSYRPNKADWLEGAWAGLGEAPDDDRRGDTGVAGEALREIGRGLVTVPEGFRLNPKIARQLEAKRAAIEAGEGIDWATAEALAIGSLCAEGTTSVCRVRTADAAPSHRHAVLVDQESEEHYILINHVSPVKHPSRSSTARSPRRRWSASNTATALPTPVPWCCGGTSAFRQRRQVIIDQFLSSGEAKWLRMSGLVMLLPHGYEGRGPSIHRPDRALSAALRRRQHSGMQPDERGELLHALRCQIRRNFRKPLVIFTRNLCCVRRKLCRAWMRSRRGAHSTASSARPRRLQSTTKCGG
jgi:2-oxoglutarate dehydrogenase E1 component